MIKLIWKRGVQGFGRSYNGYAGEIHLFTISYDACKPRGSPIPWKMWSQLPGIGTIDGDNENEMMTTAGLMLHEWLKRIGAEAKIV